MEPRVLLSAAAPKAHLFLIETAGPFASPTINPLIGGNAPFSPSDIRNFYGVNAITFGATAGTGAGETIAIVDAFSQPKLLATGSPNFNSSDLHVFDTEFNLPDPPSFIKLNENGGTILPTAYNSGWALETSLDVEWAHAMAPQANIVLVEANSNSFGDLFSAVNVARSYPGVVAVSMSWGDTESDIGSTAAEVADDATFTTPSGHAPITFVASTGDTGASATVYPSFSPNVLAIGGTSIVPSDFSTDYGSESTWNDQYGATGGNISAFEPKPSFQYTVTQSSTNRTVPDVSFNADPATGVYVLDTSQSQPGYYQVGGTSLGSPSWAGLIAVADQGRALAGLSSLSSAQTLPRIYQLSSSDFHDVTTGGNGGFSASAGYDLTTGRGTPIANLLIPDLAGGATISGQIYQDNNANSVNDGSDTGIGNRVVYLDLNGNGVFDNNDPITITNANGFYSFPDQIGIASAAVLLASPAGLVATGPATFTSSYNTVTTLNVGFFPTAFSDSTPNHSYVLQISPSNSSQIQILVNNTVTNSAPLTLLPSLSFNLSGTGDSLAVDGINGNPIPTGGVSDTGGTLLVLGSAANDTITFNTNSITFGTRQINFSNVSNLSVDPRGGNDTLTINAGAVTLPPTTPGSGILVRRFANLSVAAGASLTVASPGAHTDRTVLVAANLSINPSAKLDLGSNDLIVQNGNLALLTTLLAGGFNTGQWNGNGIASSAAQNDSTHMTALGVLFNGSSLGLPIYTTFDGVAVTKTDVLIKFTYYGDADLSGTINGDDYSQTDNGFNEHLTDWQNGDFMYTGSVNGSDYTVLDNADVSVIPLL